MKIDPDGPIGIVLTFLSIAALSTIGVALLVTIVYGAFVLKLPLMVGCVLLAFIALPLAWLEYIRHE